MNIKKRGIYAIIGLLILVSGIFTINASVIHSASEFKIKIDGTDRTLQYAVGNNLFSGSHTYASPSSIPDPGHSPDEIWVSVDGDEKTLQNALSTINGLCGSSPTTSYSGPTDPSDLSKAYHYASEIEISPGTSFQDMIDSGEFCCVPKTCAELGCGTVDDGCGVTLVCGTSHASFSCYNNDVYWYNSCGDREEKKQECGVDYCGGWERGWYCTRSWFCRDHLSGSTTRYQYKACYEKGCSGVSCYSTQYLETNTESCYPDKECWDGGESCKCYESSGKVICTELYNRGYLDEETYRMDLEYAVKHFSPEAIRGYQAWAIPVVKAMRKNPEESEEFVIPLVYSFMEEVAYRMGERETGNEAGRLFLDMGVPLFERIGVHINEPDWMSLFEEIWLESNVDPIYISIYKIATGDNIFSTINIINIILQNNEEKKYDELVKDYVTEEKIKEMYYDAKERGNKSGVAFARALLENLEGAVEEIESIVNSMEDIQK